ncbi:MAG TPA: thioredoxin [Candidatus Dependentiae bacterium]|nr:thioredoxin [Candidatus Dependentiae bacterium]
MWLLLFFALCHYTSTYTKVIKITSVQAFNKLVQEKDKPVVVEFSANWCGSCTQVKEPFEEVSSESEFAMVTFVHIDTDQLPTVCKKHCIDGVPTFLYLENGKQKERDIGLQNKHTFKDHLRSRLRKTFTLNKSKSLPRLVLLPSDYDSPMQKKNQTAYTDIIASINNVTTTIVTSIKEWLGC